MEVAGARLALRCAASRPPVEPIIRAVPRKLVRTPQEKKSLSLSRDRRNVYGANDKTSRKIVPRRKQVGQMDLRRTIAQRLRARRPVDAHAAEVMDAEVRDVQAQKSAKRFKKAPDSPLRDALAGYTLNLGLAEIRAKRRTLPPKD